jgi:MFS family permease
MSLYLYLPTLPTYTQTKTASLALVGAILAQYGLWQAIIRLPLGIAADWLGRRKLFIVVGISLSGVGAYVMGNAKDMYPPRQPSGRRCADHSARCVVARAALGGQPVCHMGCALCLPILAERLGAAAMVQSGLVSLHIGVVTLGGLAATIYAIGMFAGPWFSGILADTLDLRPMLRLTSSASQTRPIGSMSCAARTAL